MSKPTVLVIDDDAMVRQTLEILLEDSGIRVASTVDGVEGVEKFRQILPDVIVTDIVMPNKEGVAVIRELRRECPSARIIAISGSGRIGNIDVVTLATELGADTGLSKPFDDDAFIEAVRSLLGRPSMTRSNAA